HPYPPIATLFPYTTLFRSTALEQSRFSINDTYQQGVRELKDIAELLEGSNYETDRIVIDPAVVRGLEYYTGPVYEVELLLDTKRSEEHTSELQSPDHLVCR